MIPKTKTQRRAKVEDLPTHEDEDIDRPGRTYDPDDFESRQRDAEDVGGLHFPDLGGGWAGPDE